MVLLPSRDMAFFFLAAAVREMKTTQTRLKRSRRVSMERRDGSSRAREEKEEEDDDGLVDLLPLLLLLPL